MPPEGLSQSKDLQVQTPQGGLERTGFKILFYEDTVLS